MNRFKHLSSDSEPFQTNSAKERRKISEKGYREKKDRTVKTAKKNVKENSFGYDMETDGGAKQWEGVYEHTDGSQVQPEGSSALVDMVHKLKRAMQSASERVS